MWEREKKRREIDDNGYYFLLYVFKSNETQQNCVLFGNKIWLYYIYLYDNIDLKSCYGILNKIYKIYVWFESFKTYYV